MPYFEGLLLGFLNLSVQNYVVLVVQQTNSQLLFLSLIQSGKVVVSIALLLGHDIFDLLLLLQHLTVALLDPFLFSLLNLLLVRLLNLNFHLLKLDILCILQFSATSLKVLLAICNHFFFCRLGNEGTFHDSIFVVLDEVKLVMMELFLDIFLVLHLTVVFISELVFEFFVICLGHSLLMVLPLSLNFELLKVLLALDLLLDLTLVHDIGQKKFRMKRFHLILLYIGLFEGFLEELGSRLLLEVKLYGIKLASTELFLLKTL